MSESMESLERRISQLRTAVREAVLAGDRERASALRRELRQAEQYWDDALAHAQQAAAEDRRDAVHDSIPAEGRVRTSIRLRRRALIERLCQARDQLATVGQHGRVAHQRVDHQKACQPTLAVRERQQRIQGGAHTIHPTLLAAVGEQHARAYPRAEAVEHAHQQLVGVGEQARERRRSNARPRADQLHVQLSDAPLAQQRFGLTPELTLGARRQRMRAAVNGQARP